MTFVSEHNWNELNFLICQKDHPLSLFWFMSVSYPKLCQNWEYLFDITITSIYPSQVVKMFSCLYTNDRVKKAVHLLSELRFYISRHNKNHLVLNRSEHYVNATSGEQHIYLTKTKPKCRKLCEIQTKS